MTDVSKAAAEAEAPTGDPRRAELLRRTRRFRACWHELAEVLVQCERQELHRQWGYETFEAYYRRELRIRPATANKLMASYVYLSRTAPSVLDRDGVQEPIPSAESIEFLRQADECCAKGQCASGVLEQVRCAVLEQGASAAAVEKRFKALVFPTAPAAERAKAQREAIRNAAQLTARLELLRGCVSAAVLDQAAAALEQLRAALEIAPAAPAEPEAADQAERPTCPPDHIPALGELSCRPAALADEAGPTEDSYHPRVQAAHRCAVLYLCALEQGGDEITTRKLKKSVQWHLRILSSRNLGALAKLFPSRSWARLLAAGTEDQVLKPVLAPLLCIDGLDGVAGLAWSGVRSGREPAQVRVDGAP